MKSRLKCPPSILLLLSLQVGLSYGQSTHVLGSAFDQASDQLLYQEVHCELEGARQRVYYFDPFGVLLVDKILDFNSGSVTPSFIQSTIIGNERIVVSHDGKKLSLGDGKTTNVFELDGSALVIDAGFDSYIRSNWDALVDGDRLKFRFPLVSQDRLITLRVASEGCDSEIEKSYCFRLEPANWIIRKLADPISLVYDNERKLKRYIGVSNINDANGEGMAVDIQYDYLKEPHPECASTSAEGLRFHVGSTGSIL